MRRSWSDVRLAYHFSSLRGIPPRFALAVLVCVAACESNGVEGGLDFERMVVQPKGDAYDPSSLFADSMVMRMPPEGTVPHTLPPADPAVRTGRRDGAWVDRPPMGYGAALLRRGRDRFDVYCAPCHGFDGFASTPVAAAMELKRPPALVTPVIRALPDGRIFQVVTEGYGLMPSYRYQLPERDRWAVVAYVRALQLSRHLPLDSLRPDQRARILERMKEVGLTGGGGS